MADQNRDQQTENTGDNQERDQQAAGDDVAQDRNLSGASTWLNLPDKQPRGDSDSEQGDNDRQSNR